MKLFPNRKEKFYIELINTTYDKLLVYAKVKIADPKRAEDLVQEACLTAWDKIKTVMDSPNPGGWLMNALKNHILKYNSSLSAEQKISEALMLENQYTHINDSNEISFSSILSDDELEIIKLKEQGYKHYEIANMLNAKLGTIDSKVSRIKKKITFFLDNENK